MGEWKGNGGKWQLMPMRRWNILKRCLAEAVLNKLITCNTSLICM